MEENNFEHICAECVEIYGGVYIDQVYGSYIDTCHLCGEDTWMVPTEDLRNSFEVLKNYKKAKWREDAIENIQNDL